MQTRVLLYISPNGRFLDPLPGQPDVDYYSSSTYHFPKEKPSLNDWQVWLELWQRYCLPDGGKWNFRSHRNWEWFYNPASDMLVQHNNREMRKICPCPCNENSSYTRNSLVFRRVGYWQPNNLQGFSPATVRYDGA
jgi:hypothetical protein